MKKLYILTLATLVALASQAFERRTRSIEGTRTPTQCHGMMRKTAPVGTQKSAARAEALSSIDDVVGEYAWYFVDMFDEMLYYQNVDLVKVDANTIGVENMFEGITLKATFDVEEGTLTFKKQFLAHITQYDADLYLQPGKLTDEWYDDKYDLTEEVVGTWNGDAFEFDGDDMLVGDDYMGEGFYFAMAGNEIQQGYYELPPDEWEPAGTATFYDGWVAPGYITDGDQTGYEVGLEVDANNPLRYRLVNPYQAGPALQFNRTPQAEGSIVFNCSDPDHVVVEMGYFSGFTDSEGYGFYCYNDYAWLCNYLGIDVQTLVMLFGEDEEIASTLKNNEITVRGNCYGVTGEEDGGFGWTDANDEFIYTVTRVKLHLGIESLENDDKDSPAEYYNLQGVRVANPTSGLYIKRQGSQAVKAYIK